MELVKITFLIIESVNKRLEIIEMPKLNKTNLGIYFFMLPYIPL